MARYVPKNRENVKEAYIRIQHGRVKITQQRAHWLGCYTKSITPNKRRKQNRPAILIGNEQIYDGPSLWES